MNQWRGQPCGGERLHTLQEVVLPHAGSGYVPWRFAIDHPSASYWQQGLWPVRQGTVRRETTKDECGMLPHVLYVQREQDLTLMNVSNEEKEQEAHMERQKAPEHQEMTEEHQEVAEEHQEVAEEHQEMAEEHQEGADEHQGGADEHHEVAEEHQGVAEGHQEGVGGHKEGAEGHQEGVGGHKEGAEGHQEGEWHQKGAEGHQNAPVETDSDSSVGQVSGYESDSDSEEESI